MKESIKSSPLLIKIEDIVLTVFFLIIFSSHFHTIWLLYDFLAIGSVFFFIRNTNFIISTATVLAFSYFMTLAFIFDSHTISFFSIWDNGKHLFVLFMLLMLLERHLGTIRIQKFANLLGIFLPVVFILQILLVVYQYFAGYHFDDTSGTFGYGASHSVGYFCLLYISYLLFIKQSIHTLLLVSFLSFIINYVAENMGFYVLFVALIIFNWLSFKGIRYLLGYGILLVVLVFVLDVLLSGNFISPLLGRYEEFVDFSDFDLENIKASRGFLIKYALSIGGLVGVGPGAYSEIYSFTGWAVNSLYDERLQINISSATNLLAEYGVIGLVGWIFIYIIYLQNFFSDYKTIVFVSLFFIFCMLYNRLLNDERIIFMVIFIVSFIKMRECHPINIR